MTFALMLLVAGCLLLLPRREPIWQHAIAPPFPGSRPGIERLSVLRRSQVLSGTCRCLEGLQQYD